MSEGHTFLTFIIIAPLSSIALIYIHINNERKYNHPHIPAKRSIIIVFDFDNLISEKFYLIVALIYIFLNYKTC